MDACWTVAMAREVVDRHDALTLPDVVMEPWIAKGTSPKTYDMQHVRYTCNDHAIHDTQNIRMPSICILILYA